MSEWSPSLFPLDEGMGGTPRGALAIPHWSQLADRFGADPEGWSAAITDCGEECCSMVVFALRGQYTQESQIRRIMGLPNSSGSSTAANIGTALHSYNIVQRVLSVNGPHERRAIKSAIDASYPVIALGAFVSPAILHWVVVRDYGGGNIGFNDPWSGTFRYVSWSWFLRFSAGIMVECQEVCPRITVS